MCVVCLPPAVGMSRHEDFQPKEISTIQCPTTGAPPTSSFPGTTKTKSPQVAVIPPLVDLTRVASDTGDEEKKQKKDDTQKGLLNAT